MQRGPLGCPAGQGCVGPKHSKPSSSQTTGQRGAPGCGAVGWALTTCRRSEWDLPEGKEGGGDRRAIDEETQGSSKDEQLT